MKMCGLCVPIWCFFIGPRVFLFDGHNFLRFVKNTQNLYFFKFFGEKTPPQKNFDDFFIC